MTTKHLPGPWMILGTPVSPIPPEMFPVLIGVEDEEGGLPIMAVHNINGDYGDARLIAAAPDLLEACKTFVEWLDREESGFARAGNKRDTPEGERAWRDWYNENLRLCALAQEQARAAIASATGESK